MNCQNSVLTRLNELCDSTYYTLTQDCKWNTPYTHIYTKTSKVAAQKQLDILRKLFGIGEKLLGGRKQCFCIFVVHSFVFPLQLVLNSKKSKTTMDRQHKTCTNDSDSKPHLPMFPSYNDPRLFGLSQEIRKQQSKPRPVIPSSYQ